MKALLLSVGFILLQRCLSGLLSRDVDLKAWRRLQDAHLTKQGFHSNSWATSEDNYEDGSRLDRRQDCEDDPGFDCQYLASVENYCKDQKVWTMEHCPASCKYCEGPSKAPAPLVCEDDPGYDCKGLASVKNYCLDQEGWTRKHCPLSCKWCATVEPTTKQPAPPEVCEDKQGADCSDMSEEYCKDFEEDTRKNCPKSCGWCVVPTKEAQTTAEQPTTEELVETTKEATEAPTTPTAEQPTTEEIVETTKEATEAPTTPTGGVPTEEAQTTAGQPTTEEVVETTKEATEAPTTPTACIEDTNPNCPRWSDKGYCDTNSVWMKERCFKSCGYCEEPKTSQRPTEERTTKAITTEQVPETSQKPTTTREEATTKQPAPPEVCEDKEGADCSDMSEEYCKDFEEDTRKNCPKSCGWCVVPTEEAQTTAGQPTTEEAVETTKEATEAATTPTACIEDTNSNCPRWRDKGYCDTHSLWMKERCFKSCGYCEEPKTSQRPTEERTTKAITTEQVPETSQKPTQAATEQTTRAEFTKPEENTTSKPTTSEACQLKTRDGFCCVFPFKYGGREYTSCTTVDVGEPWCSLTYDFQANGRWDYCEGESGEDKLEP